MRTRPVQTLGFLFVFLFPLAALAAAPIVIGSKIFTESYILGEIASQVLEETPGVLVDRKLGLGSTGVLIEALKSGAIDVYPDYSGTLAEAILKKPELRSLPKIKKALLPLGLTISGSLGFNDTYALAVRESFAEKYHLKTMSDLKTLAIPVRAAFSYEFMDRADGYQGMAERYHFHFDPARVARMEHSLVYEAIDQNKVDMIEVYSTDANIEKFKLRVLRDDLGYFPAYQAVWVARLAFVSAHPDLWAALRKCENSISADKMVELNSRADLGKEKYSRIAAGFLGRAQTDSADDAGQIVQRTKEHLALVGVALLFSVLIGIPLGILASRFSRIGQGILIFSALFQTIPALALLCFLIPVFGIGLKPALAALCLYSLLPVVLNTFTGIRSIDPKHMENAKAFGLNYWQVLGKITLPLASPMILAGVKTATIVSIGTATLAALVGAGGYGALIISGLSLNHIPTILMGAIPAAVMALMAHFLFEGLGFLLIPKGLR